MVSKSSRRSDRLRWVCVTLGLAVLLVQPAEAVNLSQLNIPLVDDTGRTVQMKRLIGTPAIVTMEYTACRFVCSTQFSRLKELQRMADRENKKIDFLIFSLDPKSDTPEAWTEYREMRSLKRDNWHFLTSRSEDLPKVAALLGIRYWYADEHLMHDFRLLRIDSKGEVVSAMNSFGDSSEAFMH